MYKRVVQSRTRQFMFEGRQSLAIPRATWQHFWLILKENLQ